MPPKPRTSRLSPEKSAPPTKQAVQTVKHNATRKNIPPAGIEAQGTVQEAPRVRYDYNPHLPPLLRFSNAPERADELPVLLQTARERALSADEAKELADALRKHEPWLEWSGKRERPWFEVEPPALHIHERVSTQAILRVLAREDVNRDLFADPQQTYAEAVQFYKHDVDWSNRMILGDSLAVMASLARREDVAGKVQTIYVDPPYGISFKSNFQPQLGQTAVKDKEQDLTREPEMVKAYRDTWTLGIHSYLAYLRDRLAIARELLTDSGSIFVQISDENLHRVRAVLDEVFGPANFCSIIAFRKTTGQSGDLLPDTNDYLLWFARDKSQVRFRNLFMPREGGGWVNYSFARMSDGHHRKLTKSEFEDHSLVGPNAAIYRRSPATSTSSSESTLVKVPFQGRSYVPGKGGWKTSPEGFARLERAERLEAYGETLSYRRFTDDFPLFARSNSWVDTASGGYGDQKVYVVQTNTKVIERCLLMTSDPGDLVLDPTCGSGTTAFVAEKWGRRWITCDTSRVALALAKQRVMTAVFEHHKLRAVSAEDVQRNPHGAWLRNGDTLPKTFDYKTVPHITLKSIARNTALDAIFEKYEPILAEKLATLNSAQAKVSRTLKDKLVEKLIRKHREDGTASVTDADRRRWLLPDAQAGLIREQKAAKPLKAVTARQAQDYRGSIPKGAWQPWQVPFDADADWPRDLQHALESYRAIWRSKMDEVNAAIKSNAEMEELIDQPLPEPGVVRVAGPFTMEGVIAREQSIDDASVDKSPIGGAPEKLESFDSEATADAGLVASTNAEVHLDKILRLLKAAGVDFAGNKNQRFARLESISVSGMLHAEGEWEPQDGRRVAVSVGPEVGNITAWQVEDAVRSANRAGYDEVVFAGLGFDAAAQAAIDDASHPKLRLHMALIRPDVAMGELLKAQPGSQLFMVFSAPRVKAPERLPDGQWILEVEGMDVYDPVSGALYPTSRDRIAAWFVDTDYDGRTFCICQAFFPDRKKWDRLARALGDKSVVEESRFDDLTGYRTLPFARPSTLPTGRAWRVGVKVIDPRGNEGLRVLTICDE